MVSTGTDDSYVDSVFLVPTSVSINDIDSIPRVQIVNSTLTIDFPDLSGIVWSVPGWKRQELD